MRITQNSSLIKRELPTMPYSPPIYHVVASLQPSQTGHPVARGGAMEVNNHVVLDNQEF